MTSIKEAIDYLERALNDENYNWGDGCKEANRQILKYLKDCRKLIPLVKEVKTENLQLRASITSSQKVILNTFAERLKKTSFPVDSSFCEGRRLIEQAVSVNAVNTILKGMTEELS